jgi:RNA recognition motif-containing protein
MNIIDINIDMNFTADIIYEFLLAVVVMHKPGYPRPNMPPPPMNPVPGPPSDIDDTNLYVTQLPEVFSEIQLHELFGRFGPIVSTRVIKDQCKRSST